MENLYISTLSSRCRTADSTGTPQCLYGTRKSTVSDWQLDWVERHSIARWRGRRRVYRVWEWYCVPRWWVDSLAWGSYHWESTLRVGWQHGRDRGIWQFRVSACSWDRWIGDRCSCSHQQTLSCWLCTLVCLSTHSIGISPWWLST